MDGYGHGVRNTRFLYLALFTIGGLGSAVGFLATGGASPEDYALLLMALWFAVLILVLNRLSLERIALLSVYTVGIFLLFTVYEALSHLYREGLWPSLLWTGLIYPGAYVVLPPARARTFLARYFALLVAVSTLAYILSVRQEGFHLWHFNTHVQWLLSQTGMLVLSSVLYELGARAERARQAEEEARTDPLTGVANRRRFQEALAEELTRCGSRGPFPAIVLIDVDGLKKINDRYGHLAGDQLLKNVADRLRRATRAGDLLARIGGDEFAVILYNCPLEVANSTAERLRKAVTETGTTVSLGVAVAEPGDRPESLLARADRALYQAKGEGGDRVCWSAGVS